VHQVIVNVHECSISLVIIRRAGAQSWILLTGLCAVGSRDRESGFNSPFACALPALRIKWLLASNRTSPNLSLVKVRTGHDEHRTSLAKIRALLAVIVEELAVQRS
jgi:hypothetical protein